VEEELGDDIVGAGVDFGFEVVHFEGAVGGGGVAFGETGDADAEAAGVGVSAVRGAVVEFFDEADEVGGVLEGVFCAVVVGVVARGVAAEGEDVGDAVGGVAFEDGGDFGFGVADAGEVGHGVEGGGLFEADDDVVGAFACGAAGAVGDGDEGGFEGFEFADVGEELFGGVVGLGR